MFVTEIFKKYNNKRGVSERAPRLGSPSSDVEVIVKVHLL